MNVNRYLAILGFKVRDCVTGFEGVATSVSFDLPGCVMVTVQPTMDKDNKIPDSRWVDHKRLEVIGERPVLKPPTFDDGVEEAGGVDKPPMPSGRG